MRTLLATALVLAAGLVACGRADQSESATRDAPSASRTRGPEALVLRVARTGGRARVYAYPRVDSLLWDAPGAPAIGAVLGFDPDEGVIVYVDDNRVPGRIDLRLGDVERAGSRFTLTGARTADGSSVFGVADGEAVRFTATGRWEFAPDRPVSAVFPQPDGSLVAMSRVADEGAKLWRVFPPETTVLDSGAVSALREGPRVQGGDRLYLATDDGFAVLHARTLVADPPLSLDAQALAAVATPSGDRLFVALAEASELAVYERYRGRLGTPVALPGPARAMRMDPVGRFLLVRPAEGDSVWVVALGTSRHSGTVRSAWRDDLPLVASDGGIVTARGVDVVIVDGTTLRETTRVAGGAADFWYAFQWTGFRPRAVGLDRPAEFSAPRSDTVADTAQVDSASAATDSTGSAPGAPPTPQVPQSQTQAPQPTQWTVSFAAVLSEGGARTLADQITVDGTRARVLATVRDGAPVYRVILGPYADRESAERAGRAAGRPYWVYASTP